MKKTSTLLTIGFALFSASVVSAQCSSCTLTITGADATDHYVTAGTTLCVAPGGNATGLILVDGGTLCNQGQINTTNVAVIHGGSFYNYGTANVDSLWVTNNNSKFLNYGPTTGYNMAVSDMGLIQNSNTITMDYLADSAGTLVNNNNLVVNYDMGVAYNAVMTNHGNWMVSQDFYSSYSSSVVNDAYMNVGRDFLNSTSANFMSYCMVSVGRDWLNSGIITGPPSSCGGFSIVGNSYNSGTVGGSSQHVDLCDAGHPATGIDWNGGTIASSTTYCSCSNSCSTVGIVEQTAPTTLSISNSFPNPCKDALTVQIKSELTCSANLEIHDMTGKLVYNKESRLQQGDNTIQLNLGELSDGSYLLAIHTENGSSSKQLITVKR